jgi:hypothetical protein
MKLVILFLELFKHLKIIEALISLLKYGLKLQILLSWKESTYLRDNCTSTTTGNEYLEFDESSLNISDQENCKINAYNRILDTIITSMKTRFSSESLHLASSVEFFLNYNSKKVYHSYNIMRYLFKILQSWKLKYVIIHISLFYYNISTIFFNFIFRNYWILILNR